MTDELIVKREERLWVRSRTTLDLVTSAKLDVYYLLRNRGLVVDFKSGFKNPSPSEINWQLRVQAVALWQAYPSLVHVRSGFLRNRLSSTVDFTDYTVEDLGRVEREIFHVLWRANQPDAPRVPGPHCRWCRASGPSGTCREWVTYGMVSSAGMPAMPDQLGIVEAVGKLTPAELGFVFQRKSTVERVFKSVEAALKALPADQLESAGYKTVPGNTYYDFTDTASVFQALGELLTPLERVQCMDIVLGRAATILQEKHKISEQAAKEKVRAHLGDLLIKRTGNPKLKPI